MKKIINISLFILLSFVLFSCLSKDNVKVGDNFRPVKNIPQGKALVYIYRPTYWAAMLVYDIYANGALAIGLPANTYYPYITNPGRIVFSAKTEVKKEVVLNAAAGKTYFLLCSVTPGFWVGHPYFKFVDAKEGMGDLQKLKVVYRVK